MPRPNPNLQEALEKRLLCPLCQSSFFEPHTAICCLKTFCFKCYFEAIRKESKCPGCSQHITMKTNERGEVEFDLPRVQPDALYDELSDIIKPDRRFRQLRSAVNGKSMEDAYVEYKKEIINRGEFYYGSDDLVSFCLEHDQNLPSDRESDGEETSEEAKEESAAKEERAEPSSKKTRLEEKDKPSTSKIDGDKEKWMLEPFSPKRFRRFFRCPAKATIGHVKKLLRQKLCTASPYVDFIFKYRYYNGQLTDDTSLRTLLNQQPPHARLRCMRIFFKVAVAQSETPPMLEKEAMPSLEAECDPELESEDNSSSDIHVELKPAESILVPSAATPQTTFVTPPVQPNSNPFNGSCQSNAPRKRSLPKSSPEVTPPNSSKPTPQPAQPIIQPRFPVPQQGQVLQQIPFALMCRQGEIPPASMQFLQQLTPEQQNELFRSAASAQQQHNLLAQAAQMKPPVTQPPRIQSSIAATTPSALQAQLATNTNSSNNKPTTTQSTSTVSSTKSSAPTALEMLQAEGQQKAASANLKGLQLPTSSNQPQVVKPGTVVINGTAKQAQTPKASQLPIQILNQHQYTLSPSILQQLLAKAPPGTVIQQKPGCPPVFKLPDGQLYTPQIQLHPNGMPNIQMMQLQNRANSGPPAKMPKLSPSNGSSSPAQSGPSSSLKLPVATIPRTSTQVAATIMTVPLPSGQVSSTTPTNNGASPIVVRNVGPTGAGQKEYNKVVQPQNGQSVHTVQPLLGANKPASSPITHLIAKSAEKSSIVQLLKSNENGEKSIANGEKPMISQTPPPRLSTNDKTVVDRNARSESVQPQPVTVISPPPALAPNEALAKSPETPTKADVKSGETSPNQPISSPTVDSSMDILTLSKTHSLPLGKALRDSLKASKNHGVNALEGVKTS